MPTQPGEIGRNIASLFGGVAVAAAVLILWLLVTSLLGWSGPLNVAGGVILAALSGLYVRLADL